MSSLTDDPRDPAAEAPMTFPGTWQSEGPDGYSATVMFISGLILVTRNRFLAWPAVLLALNSFFTQHPLRTKESTSSTPLGSLGMAAGALMTAYLPMILVPGNSKATQTPLPAQ